jgi:uncharacterized membrane protein
MLKLYANIKENYFLFVILFLSAILRVYHIDFQSLWIDEISTMIQATPHLSFTDTYEHLLKLDLQPPLYFYILKYLFKIFSYTAIVMRLFSAFLGVAGVWAIYLLGKELFHKKVGLYAALLMCLNYFHIYYSQEGRPYAFLILFTILSFYGLIRFIKNSSYKNAIYYGVLSSLMLYGHPFGMLHLFAQYLILLYCFLKTNDSKLTFFKQLLTAGITTFVLYIPAIPLFLNAAGISSFWIPKPDTNVYSTLLLDFFGHSETLIVLVYLMSILFFMSVFNFKEKFHFVEDIRENKVTAGFMVLFMWIVIGLLIPLIRSYLSVPMIVSRYFIGLLPSIILMVAMGIYQIQQQIIKNAILTLIVLFSLTDIVVVKDYYNKIVKSQIREISSFVKTNYENKEPVISSLNFYYGFYLDPKIYHLSGNNLSAIAQELMNDSNKIKAFWYVDAHNRSINTLTSNEKAFLDKTFYTIKKINLYDAWAIYFSPKKENKIIALNLEEFSPIKSDNGIFLPLYATSSTFSKPIALRKGNYTLIINGKSEPLEPVNDINAHISVKLNGKFIGGFFLSENTYPETKSIHFSVNDSVNNSFEICFDNDFNVDKKDRNAFIYWAYAIRNNSLK